MCNLSQGIAEINFEKGINQGIQQGVEKERLNAIERMLKAGASKDQIISYGYTEEELIEAENGLCVNA